MPHGPWKCNQHPYSLVDRPTYAYVFAARHELLEFEGLEHEPDIPGYTLTDLQMKYKAPLCSQDVFLVSVGVIKATRARVEFSQRVIKLDSLAVDNDVVRLLAQCAHCLHQQRTCQLRTDCRLRKPSQAYVYVQHAAGVDAITCSCVRYVRCFCTATANKPSAERRWFWRLARPWRCSTHETSQ